MISRRCCGDEMVELTGGGESGSAGSEGVVTLGSSVIQLGEEVSCRGVVGGELVARLLGESLDVGWRGEVGEDDCP